MTGLSADVTALFTASGAESFTVDAAVAVEEGETLVVLGPSGSGKTLLLETIAGFHPHEGTVALAGDQVQDVAPEDRDFGFVFQDYALFPHRSVRENVAFGQRYSDRPVAAHPGKPDRPPEWPDGLEPAVERVANVRLPNPNDLLEAMGVGDLAARSPKTLSGGEKQRVALARSLAVDPSVLLLDEPLAALDVPTRQSLRDTLADVLADVTAVYVTHNRTTARALADRIAVMHDGDIVQTGTPEDVFERPETTLVAEFTGANVLPLDATPGLCDRLADQVDAENAVFRPENVRLLNPDDADAAEDGIPAAVERVVREDATCRVTLSVDGGTIEVFADDPPAVGERVRAVIPDDSLHGC